MGCRPSKHATSKIRDAHARGKHCACMYSPRKYNKKHKCNSNGTGSRRTSGGTHSGSHGHSSTDHRSRSHKSDDTQFPAFSTTTAVYRRSASKASKITLRLSSDGSTLEIEQCEFDIAKSKPPVKPVSRPWNSAPNLLKVSDRGSPMLRNLDLLLLRPSTSAWTNACASRSTPGSDHVPSAWRVHSAVRQRDNFRQTNFCEDRTGHMNIRETELIDCEPNNVSNIQEGIDKVCVSNDPKFNQILSDFPQNQSLSTRMTQAVIHPMAFGKEAPFQPSNQTSHPLISPTTIASTFSNNENRPSQFRNTPCVNSDTVRRREKCTASLRRPEPPKRAGYHHTSVVQNFQKCANDSRGNNENNADNQNDLKKLYQRASIPRYDCFRIRDYNNIYSQSASSILDSSIQSEVPQYSTWFETWQKHLKDNGEASSNEGKSICTERLTDREKLVLNLSTRPSSMGDDCFESKALVGRRDEKWHSNENLISGQNKERIYGSILNSPVESDTVLTFVELGCPVAHQEDQYNPELGSPLSFYSPVHAPPCLGQCELFPKEIYQHKPMLNENDWTRNQKASDIEICVPNTFSSMALSNTDNAQLNRQSDTSALDRFLLRNLEKFERGSPQKGGTSERGMEVVQERKLLEGSKIEENTWQQTDNQSSPVQFGPYVPEMGNYKLPYVNSPQQIEISKQNLKDQKEGEAGNNNYRIRPMSASRDNESTSAIFSAHLDENGNSNYEKILCPRRSLELNCTDLIDNKMCIGNNIEEDSDSVLEERKCPSKLLDNESKISTDEEVTETEIHCLYSGQNSQYVYDIILNRLSDAHTESLPLLCYNNSFGKRFQATNILSNDSNVLDEANTMSSYSFHRTNEETECTDGLFHPCRDQIDITLHSPQILGMERGTYYHSDVIKSTTDFHGTTVSENKIDAPSDSRKFCPDGSANSTIVYSTNNTSTMSHFITDDESTVVLHSGDASCESREVTNVGPSHTAMIKKPTAVDVISNEPESRCTLDEGALPSDPSSQANRLVRLVKINQEITAKNSCRVSDPSATPTVAPVARSPLPLRILQARIIGRNLSDFATRCLLYGSNAVNVSTSSSPAALLISTDRNDPINEAMGKGEGCVENKDKLSSSVNMASSEQIPKQNAETCVGACQTNITSNVNLQKQYAIKHAIITDGCRGTVHSRNFETASSNENDVENSSKSVISLGQDSASSFSSEQVPFSAKTSGTQLPVTSSSTSFAHSDISAKSLAPQSLLHDSSTTSVSHPSTVAFTCPDGETNFPPLAQSFPLPVPDLTSSSNEPYFLANTQLLSSHSSDSLSCSLSSYSLSNTLHSDTVVSDTTHSDTVHSDTNLSDNVNFDTNHCDIVQPLSTESDTVCLVASQVDIHQTNTQQEGLSLQSGNDESSIHQASVAFFDSYHSDTPKSNIVRPTTPSSFVSSQSHSPRSTPQSTLSPHSSSSSQCTLSPPTTPPLSSFSERIPDRPLPDLTCTQNNQKLDRSTKTNIPSLQSSFVFSQSTPAPSSNFSSSSSSPPLPSSPLTVNSFSAVDSELSIVDPSTSCRALPASNPESHQNHPITDIDGTPCLNPDEIQNSSWMPAPYDRSKHHPEKWNAPISLRSKGTMDISTCQNDHHHNSSTPTIPLTDGKAFRESIGNQIFIAAESREEDTNRSHVINDTCTFHDGEIDTGSGEEINHSQIRHDKSVFHSEKNNSGNTVEAGISKPCNDSQNYVEPSHELNQRFQNQPFCVELVKTKTLDLFLPTLSADSTWRQTVSDEMHSNNSHYSCDNASANESGYLHVDGRAICSQIEVSPGDCEGRQRMVAESVKESRSGLICESDRNMLCCSLHLQTSKNLHGSCDIGNGQSTNLYKTEESESLLQHKRSNVSKKWDIVDGKENDSNKNWEKARGYGDSLQSGKEYVAEDALAHENKNCCEDNFDAGRFESDPFFRDTEDTEKTTSENSRTVSNYTFEHKLQCDEIASNEENCITDGVISQESENPSDVRSSWPSTLEALDQNNQNGLFTMSSGHANQINIETAKQTSLDKKSALAMDPSISSINCANTEKAMTEQGQKCHIDSLCHFEAIREDQDQRAEDKTERPKRNVQLLVKHFESVSLRSSAEAQPSDKL